MAGKLLVAATVVLAGIVAGRLWIGDDPLPRRTGPLPSAVVLVTIDTLRADAVSYAGKHDRSTPFLDQLAAKSVVYTQAYAPSSWTAPSMASLFTGLDPRSHGVRSGHIEADAAVDTPMRAVQPVLADSLSTLAEHFQQAGYATIGTPANLHLASSLGFAQGFDSYFDAARFLDAPDLNRRLFQQLHHLFGPDWAKVWKDRPAFVWAHYFDPHIPYMARQPWIYQWVADFERQRGIYPDALDFPELQAELGEVDATEAARLWPLYLSEVRYVDERLRALHARLDLADPNVLLIVTSDHGEELGDHGQIGHAVTLYEEVVHVPLLIHWPAGIPSPARIDTPVSLLDIFPTLVQLAGLEAPPVAHGKSLPLQPPAHADERTFLFETQRGGSDVSGLRQGDWKLVLNPADSTTPVRLFDLRRDPGETHNLAHEHADIAERLQHELADRQAALPAAPADAGHAEINDTAVQERLRSLGYQ